MSNLKLTDPISETLYPSSLEKCIRVALASRQLPVNLEQQIKSLELKHPPSRTEKMLLDILNDAVAEGCVVRTS